ncbi:glycine oxidase ThiO [Glutamicibacter uratoxydans]|uniref:glycine oxidase n=1 Tax=Glutamicibacter uratoxydans TaxID=43667 RepID=A0A4Y4DSH5_GLUUR|nr:glycine oxidase ThiO [Glutamicibacter uratoxydans]GED07856.1 glycine oxidase ThiO [Glutamicibacter uratoxydans]
MHVVIIGAGIIGLATAFELQSRGCEVTLIDPTSGQGASRAAAGMLAPAGETTWGQGILHELLGASNELYPDFVRRIEDVTGRRPDYLQNSTLVIAAEPADRDALHDLVELQNSLGFSAETLLPSAARRLEPALASNIAGAVLCKDDHQIDPRSVTGILGELFADRIIAEAATELISVNGATRAVRTSSGRIVEGDQIVLAAGLGQVPGAPKLPLRPVYGDILRMQGPARYPLLSRTIRGIVHREAVYLVPRKDGSIVLGASSREDGNSQVNIGHLHKLLDNARRLVPGIVDCSLNEVIARARPGTPDDRPLIGRVDESLVISTGYSRHGVLLSPLGSALTADLVLGAAANQDHAAAVDPNRFAGRQANEETPAPTIMEMHR